MPPVNDEVSASTWTATLRGFNSTQTRLRVAKGEGSRFLLVCVCVCVQ